VAVVRCVMESAKSKLMLRHGETVLGCVIE
jgi:hypothetical protein